MARRIEVSGLLLLLAVAASACSGELGESSDPTALDTGHSATNQESTTNQESATNQESEPDAHRPGGRLPASQDGDPHAFQFSDFDASVRGRTSIEILAWSENDGASDFRVLLRSVYAVLPPDEGYGGHQCWMTSSEAVAFGTREHVTACSGESTALRYPTPFEDDGPGRIMEVGSIELTELDDENMFLTFELRRMVWDEAAPDAATLTIHGPVDLSCAVTNAAALAEAANGEEPLRDTMWESDACQAAVQALGMASYVRSARTAFP